MKVYSYPKLTRVWGNIDVRVLGKGQRNADIEATNSKLGLLARPANMFL